MQTNVPIDRLPAEVVGEIFFRLPKPVWPLQAVCKRWRDIIINTSRFWTNIQFKQHRELGLVDSLRLQTGLAERSGRLPLDVAWALGILPKDKEDQLYIALLDLFRQAPTTRWRTFNMKSLVDPEVEVFLRGFPQLISITLPPFDPCLERFLSIVNATCPGLKEFRADGNWEDYSSHLPDVVNQLSVLGVRIPPNNLPNISLRLDVTVVSDGGLQDEILDLTDLRVNTLGWIRVAHWDLPNLRHLEVITLLRLYEGTLRCSNLQSLVIPGNSLHNLQHLVVPNLKELTLTRSHDTSLFSRLVLEPRYLPPGLLSLVIFQPFSFDKLPQVLKMLTALRELEILVNSPGQLNEISYALGLRGRFDPKTSLPLNCPDLAELTLHVNGGLEAWQHYGRDSIMQPCRKLHSIRKSCGLKLVRVEWFERNEAVVLS